MLFTDLPTEIITKILLSLDGYYIVQLARLCHRLSDIVKDDLYLRYEMELHATDMANNTAVDMNTLDRITKLKEYVEKHDQDDWGNFLEFEMEVPLSSGWETLPWHFKDGILVMQLVEGDEKIFRVRDLRTQGEWKYPRVGEEVNRVLVDGSQDLFIIVEENIWDGYSAMIRLCSLKTGGIHPEAAVPTVQFKSTFMGLTTISMDLFDCHLFIREKYSPEKSRIWVMNWKVGRFEKVLDGPFFACTPLGSDLLLLCGYDPSEEYPLFLMVAALKLPVAEPRLILRFPKFATFPVNEFYSNFCSGAFNWKSSSRSACLPYHPSPEDSVIFLETKRDAEAGSNSWYCISRLSVSEIYSKLPPQACKTPRILEWGMWHEKHFPSVLPEKAITGMAVHGQRAAKVNSFENALVIYDLQRRHAHEWFTTRSSADPSSPTAQSMNYDREICDDGPGEYKAPWLPATKPVPIAFRLYILQLEGREVFGVAQVAMDADRIVISRSRNGLNDNVLSVYRWAV